MLFQGYDGLRDTRKRKIDINHNFPNDGEEKSENKKRRLDNKKVLVKWYFLDTQFFFSMKKFPWSHIGKSYKLRLPLTVYTDYENDYFGRVTSFQNPLQFAMQIRLPR